MRSLHETVAKEKCDEIFLIEAGNAANSQLLANFPTKSRGISAIFTRHLFRAKVSLYMSYQDALMFFDCCLAGTINPVQT